MIPSALVLVASAVVGYNLITDAVLAQKIAEASRIGATQGTDFFPNLMGERGASLLYLAAPTPENKATLDQARTSVNNSSAALVASSQQIYDLLPPEQRTTGTVASFVDALTPVRAQVDARTIPRADVSKAYNQLTDLISLGSSTQAARAQSANSANSINRSGDLHRVADLIDRANSVLAAGLVKGDLSPADYDEYVTDTGGYRAALQVLIPRLDPPEQQRIAQLQAGPDWQQISAMADAVLPRGYSETTAAPTKAAPLPDPVAAALAARNLSRQFMGIGFDRRAALAEGDTASAQDVVRTTVTVALVVLVVLVVGFLIALAVTTRLVRRLGRLRRQTLDMANTSLPLTLTRVRKGDRVDLDRELPPLDHGRDEIGQVAAAFNKAQRFAVDAAVEESQTREGFNAAFLNIARRSQAILHQQMRVLDQIERSEPDPDRLDLLFSLDHLATRERRNAENLIILGGEQPRRQWRNPVALGELARAAVGESEHYQRVTIGSLPHVMVDGAAVGDLVHLIAELVDNATAFSPPAAPIEVHGTVVGRGVVIEVEDQGLGIEEDQLAVLNEMLADPPDFGLFTLSRDSRIGLFVVARLARRHQVKVTLRASAFGGVRAGLLIPTTALAGDAQPGGSPWELTAGSDTADRLLPVRVGAGVGASNGRGSHLDGNGRGDYADGPATGGYEVDDPYPVAPVRVPSWVNPQDVEVLQPAAARRGGSGRGGGPGTDTAASGLPRLPRRTRQSHMDARLAEQGRPEPAPPPDPDTDLFTPPAYSPETARNRMSALRRGAAQARMQDIGPDDSPYDSPYDSPQGSPHGSTEGRRW
jgi:signal transduction histidine kinase